MKLACLKKILLRIISERNSSYSSDASQSNKVRDDTDNCDEGFLPATQQVGPFVNHGSDESFKSTKLGVETNKEQHDEKQAGPKRRPW